MTIPTLRPIAARGLGTATADTIREAIMDGTFAPGEALREGPLAESLAVSRGSVREGLALLEREGLVRTGWHRPATVVTATRARAQDLYRLRAGLDRVAVVAAAAVATEADLAAPLARLAEVASSGASRDELVTADLAFHDAVYRVAGNEPLTAAWEAIRSQVRLYQLLRSSEQTQGYAESLHREHADYARLVLGGDAAAAATCAEEHVGSALAALLRRLPTADPADD